MKLIRFVSEDGVSYFGVVESQEDKTARIIQGDTFETVSVTDEERVIQSFLPPVMPPNIIGIGLNYADHADETGIRHPEIPVMFLKGTNAINAHLAPIVLPEAGPDEVDFEAELAIVIGKSAKNVSSADAMSCVLGYCCANDVSARDWQIRKQKQQWARGKSFDTFCPIGPFLVTRDELPEPNNLAIRTEINGEVYQSSNTSEMIFDVPTLVSQLSRSMTLLPGTVILTGTPDGVGFTRQPPVFLKKGDTVTVTIDKIGSLTNPVTREE
jgi:2-keto-4-pentenoate hydratase/2-oxohepta-3-ene-1,7-dioic acid hydratase in catechol pathway